MHRATRALAPGPLEGDAERSGRIPHWHVDDLDAPVRSLVAQPAGDEPGRARRRALSERLGERSWRGRGGAGGGVAVICRACGRLRRRMGEVRPVHGLKRPNAFKIRFNALTGSVVAALWQSRDGAHQFKPNIRILLLHELALAHLSSRPGCLSRRGSDSSNVC